jgi:hypothetical protein
MLWASVIAHPWGSTVPVEANLGAFLDKDWENRSLARSSRRRSVRCRESAKATLALEQAFNMKTVGELGNSRYFRAAQLLAQLAEAGAT